VRSSRKVSRRQDLFGSSLSGRALIETGVSVQIEPGFYGRIADRSGLCFFDGVHVGGGVVDSHYTGTLKILLFNLSDQDVQVSFYVAFLFFYSQRWL
jgi:dUTPase